MARLTALAVVLFLVSRISASDKDTLPVSVVVLLPMIGILIGISQLLPLPTPVVESISAQAVEARTNLGAVPGDTANLSVVPHATRQHVSLLVIAVTLVFLGSQLFRSPGQQQFAFWCISLNAALLGLWGLYQFKFCPNEILPGEICIPKNGAIFSTYVNHSSAAGYLNLGLAAMVGLGMWAWSLHSTAVGRVEMHLRCLHDEPGFVAQLDRLAAP